MLAGVCLYLTTVGPPNKGLVGTSTDVRYSKVVLYWGVSAKNRFRQNTLH